MTDLRNVQADGLQVASLTTGGGYWTTAAAPSFGIGSMRLADGPHGLRVQNDDDPDHLGLGRSRPATCFPPAVTLAATWDVSLLEEVGAALGHEARAQGVNVVLGPGINIKRSPLCGRNFEYFSEDPLLTGRLAAAMVRGIQSNCVASCLKHFAVNNQETDRMWISADVDERTLREIYLRAFEIAVREGLPWTIMSAYNRINNVPASENPWLLTEVLRDEWEFDGVVISDWGAVRDPVAALKAGLDLRMPGRPSDSRVANAVRNGDLDPAAVLRAANRLRRLSERTRAADAPSDARYDEHHCLARRAAAQSAVLLHNTGGLLPIDPAFAGSVAVIGELARTPRYQGAGSSAVNPTRTVSPLDALRARLEGSVGFEPGYSLDNTEDAECVGRAVELARGSDLVLLFLGLPPMQEAEGRDRTSIDLPSAQVALLEAVAQINPRVVVALNNGSVVTTASWRSSAGAVVEFWLGGQAFGDAVVDVLTGEVNPSGKLTETVPLRLEDGPAYLAFPGEEGHVRYAEGIYVGYRWYDARNVLVDYPFGHGLSYTRFDYSDLQVETFAADDPRAFRVTAVIANVGQRDGAEVVQLYVGTPDASIVTPLRELRAFQKIKIAAGEKASVVMEVSRDSLAHYFITSGWAFEGGALDIALGSSSRDLRLTARITVAGRRVQRSLTVWSPLGDWLDNPAAAARFWHLIDSRGGMKGRIADLLGDPTGIDSARGFPLVAITQFPGVPLTEDDAARILADISND